MCLEREDMKKTCFCGLSERYCGYQIETDMKQHDKVIFEDGYNKAIDDLKKYIRSEISNNDFFNENRILNHLAKMKIG